MTKDGFQQAHGPAWAAITANPAFFAAMQHVSTAKLQRIATITDTEIKEHGTAILSDFRGHLQLENALIDLAVADHQTFSDLPPETYADPNGTPLEQPLVEPSASNSFADLTPFHRAPDAPQPPKRNPKKKK